MTPAAHFLSYTAEIMSFSMAADASLSPFPPPGPDAVRTNASRLLKAWERNAAEHVVLSGLGSGQTAETLAGMLPKNTDLTICELTPAKVAALQNADRLPAFGPRFGLIADTSVWAHLCLTAMHGLTPETVFFAVNPELPPAEKHTFRELSALFRKSSTMHIDTPTSPVPSISLGAILSPGEPMLKEFMDQIPGWVHDAVFVWDAAEVPDIAPPAHLPENRVRHIAAPLESGFDVQRNIMLDACTGDWIFTLDGDELLPREQWERLPALTSVPGIAGFHFPRTTFHPDESRVRAGFGLWPDLQLRFFARTPEVRYTRPIHERLAGLRGRQAAAIDMAIAHYSHLVKSEAELENKLRRFDSASQGTIRHTLSRDYPGVPLASTTPSTRPQSGSTVLLLPEIME